MQTIDQVLVAGRSHLHRALTEARSSQADEDVPLPDPGLFMTYVRGALVSVGTEEQVLELWDAT